MDWFQLLMLIGAWGFLGAACVVAASAFFGGRQVLSISVGVFLIGFLMRVVAIMLNEEFAFLEAKLSGNRSIWLFERYILDGGGWLGLLGEEFGLQVLINIPVWLVFGASRMALLFSNAAIGALAAPLACVLLYRDFKQSGSLRALLLLSLYPAGFNFSIFGLRDPIIFLGMLILSIGGVRLWTAKLNFADIGLLAMGVVGVMSLRPELAYVVLIILMLPLMSIYVDMVMSSRLSKKALSSLLCLTLPLVLLGCGAVVAATRVAGGNIGIKTFNPADLAGDSAVDRFSRHSSALGGGSHMMSAAAYQSMPWYYRVPIQTAGLIMLPFPWQVNNTAMLLAFADSLFVIGLAAFALLNAWFCEPIRRKGVGRLTIFMLLISLVGFIGFGFVVSNFGNGFRMKLAVTPMVFVAAAIVPIRVRFLIGSRKPVQPAVRASAKQDPPRAVAA